LVKLKEPGQTSTQQFYRILFIHHNKKSTWLGSLSLSAFSLISIPDKQATGAGQGRIKVWGILRQEHAVTVADAQNTSNVTPFLHQKKKKKRLALTLEID
jgi:hypothetical protein